MIYTTLPVSRAKFLRLPKLFRLSFQAEQADFFFRVRSCERVGLRSRGISLEAFLEESPFYEPL